MQVGTFNEQLAYNADVAARFRLLLLLDRLFGIPRLVLLQEVLGAINKHGVEAGGTQLSGSRMRMHG